MDVGREGSLKNVYRKKVELQGRKGILKNVYKRRKNHEGREAKGEGGKVCLLNKSIELKAGGIYLQKEGRRSMSTKIR